MRSVAPQLNLDVLRVICSFLTVVQDVLSFSLACSALRTSAVERRLPVTMRPITISHAQSLRDLHHFVFVNKERRGPHLRAIEVPMNISREDLSKDLADHFLALLASATRLRTLTLYVPGSPRLLFTGHPDVLPAVAQLTSLRELNIAASIEEVVVLLGSTRSSLKAFRYQPTYESHESSESLTESQAISVAPQLATTLEEIEVPSDFLMIASRSHASFPTVRSLTLTDPESDEAFRWKVNPLLRLFPNLNRTLIIDTDIYDRPAVLRAANREAQKKRAWTALDRVACTNPDVLYALGLTCPIRHLTLELNLERMHGNGPVFQRSVDEIRAVLEEAASSHLALIHDGLSGRFSALYKSLFPPDSDALASLTHLVVETGYMSLLRRDPRHGPHCDTHEDSKADVILDSPLLSGLKSATLHRLTHLRIIMATGTRITSDDTPRWSSFTGICNSNVRYFKFDSVVAALPSVLPSLAYIFVMASGSIVQAALHVHAGESEDSEEGMERKLWGVSRAWRVRRRPRDHLGSEAESEGYGGKHDLEELSAEEAETMIDTEELHPTERTYWGVVDESLAVESDDSTTGT